MRILPDGRATATAKDEFWGPLDGSEATNTWDALRARLEPSSALRDQARAELFAGEIGLCRFPPLNPLAPYLMQEPILTGLREAGDAFFAASLLAMHDRRGDAALAELRAGLCVVGLLRPLPVPVAHAYERSLTDRGLRHVWEGLQSGLWTECQLADLQRSLEGASLLPGLARTFESARALQLYWFYGPKQVGFRSLETVFVDTGGIEGLWPSLVRSDKQPLGWLEVFESMSGATARLRGMMFLGWWKAAWTPHDEAFLQRACQSVIDACERAEAQGCWGASGLNPKMADFRSNVTYRVLGRRETSYDRERFWPTLSTLSSLAGEFQRTLEVEAFRRLAVVAVALERYRVSHEKEGYPEGLNGLVPALLGKLPPDFFDGKPVRYRRLGKNDYLLYCVGSDGADDAGGGPTMTQPLLRGFYDGKDLVWPRQAKPSP